MGLQGVPDALSSRRVHGAVLAPFARKDVLKQRSLFTKAQVVSLELFVMDEAAAPDMERDNPKRPVSAPIWVQVLVPMVSQFRLISLLIFA